MYLVGTEQYMVMEEMIIGNRRILFNVGILLLTLNLYSQELKCFDNIDYNQTEDLVVVLDDYINIDSKFQSILLVDFCPHDSSNIFRVTSSLNAFELFYKKPDCYWIYKNKIVYLFTDSHVTKDSLWLNKVLERTTDILDYPNVEVLWKADSIIDVFGYATIGPDYSPPIMEYQIKTGVVERRKLCKKMLFPDTGKPKGVMTIQDLLIQ